MSEFVYKDYLPANARVIIDYKKEQKVSFSYPIEWSYWKDVWKRGYFTVLGFWVVLHAILFRYFFYYLLVPIIVIKSIFFPFIIERSAKLVIIDFGIVFVYFLLPMIITAFYFFALPAIATLILAFNTDILSYWLPKMGYWSAYLLDGRKEATFTEKDVSGKKCIIPAFSNIFLKYKANGEFNEYLEKVEILEMPFNYKKRKFFSLRPKNERNDFDFRAVFYFSETPRKGWLNVEFI